MEQVLVRTTTLFFIAATGPNGQVLSDDVQCQAGESVVGGGADIDPLVAVAEQPNALVTSSRPADANGTSPPDLRRNLVVGSSPSDGTAMRRRTL